MRSDGYSTLFVCLSVWPAVRLMGWYESTLLTRALKCKPSAKNAYIQDFYYAYDV